MGAGPELHGYTQWGSKTPELPSRVLNQHGIFPTIFQLLRDARPEAEIGCLYEWDGIKYLVDINTLYNPYHKRLKNGKEVVEPATARTYLDRSKNHAYMIKKGDLCYRLFKAKGFRWGGDWKHSKDYQHFEK